MAKHFDNDSIKYSDDIYRPANATLIRSHSDFTHHYNILYPIHEVTTFETAATWITSNNNNHVTTHARGGSSESVSATRSRKSKHTHTHAKSERSYSTAYPTQAPKSSKGCCVAKAKDVSESSSDRSDSVESVSRSQVSRSQAGRSMRSGKTNTTYSVAPTKKSSRGCCSKAPKESNAPDYESIAPSRKSNVSQSVKSRKSYSQY